MTLDSLPSFLAAELLKPFISEELMGSTTPIFFRLKGDGLPAGYRKLGEIALPPARSTAIRGSIAELIAHPAYVAYRAEVAAAKQVQASFASASWKLDNVMTLNGRSF